MRVNYQILVSLAFFAFSTILCAAPAQAGDAKCDLLLSYLDRPTQTIPFDVPPREMSTSMLDIRRLIIQTEPGEFNAIWQTVGKNDFLDIVSQVRDGKLEILPEQRDKLFALEEFVLKDQKNVLWSGRGGPWSSLHTYYPEFTGPSHKTRLGGTIAGIDTFTLKKLEKEIISTAKNEGSRLNRGTIWQRLVRHPYHVAKNIVQYNNQIRERLEHLEDVPAAMEREVKKEGLQLTHEEQVEIENLYDLLRGARHKLVEELAKVYGQPITTGGFQAVMGAENADIYTIDKNIKELGVLQSRTSGEYILLSEQAIDGLNRILDQARIRKGLSIRTEADQDNIELRVRHHKHRRLYNKHLNKWLKTMSKGTGESIRVGYYWYETEFYTVQESGPDGKMQTVTKSKLVRKSSSARVEMTYYDVLVNRMDKYSIGRSFRQGTIESISGKSSLLDASVEAASVQIKHYNLLKFEEALINKMESHAQTVLSTQGQNRKDHKKSLQLLTDWETVRLGILDLILQNNDSEGVVKNRWADDSYNHFLARNQQFEVVLNDLREVYEIYYEQWLRGEYELVITPDVLTHDWRSLKLRYYGSIARNTIAGASLTGLSLCTGQHFISNYGSCLTALWQYMSPYIDQLSSLFY